jgi:hypothetical protein
MNAPDVVRRFLQKCHFALRKPPFYPLNYGNKDNCDFRFAIADCKQCAAGVWRSDILALAECGLSDARNYIAIERLILRHDAIC